MKRRAFTMMELIFVIVIIGIIAKFGVEMLIKAYDNYVFSTVQNRLEQSTGFALQEIANRLSYRIKPSIIVRNKLDNNYTSLAEADTNQTLGTNAILEWIGYDDAGFRGSWNGAWNKPDWSGFIDLNNSAHTSSNLISLGTNTKEENATIEALSGGTAGINDSAIYFIDGNITIHKFGWGGAIKNQQEIMHPIKAYPTNTDPTNVDILQSKFAYPNDFNGTRVYEFYQLAWSAYALVYSGTNTSSNVEYPKVLDNNNSNNLFGNVLPHGLQAGSGNGQWRETTTNHYILHISGKDVPFTYNPANGTFTCNASLKATGTICKGLTQ